jgi:phosphoenolpyruvate synthase/pyruvate phosphate dikinase
MNESLRRAVEALETGASEVRKLYSASQVRQRLQQTVDEVLSHLEEDEREPEDVFSRLDRQSREIAEDLRRAERLMRERQGRE